MVCSNAWIVASGAGSACKKVSAVAILPLAKQYQNGNKKDITQKAIMWNCLLWREHTCDGFEMVQLTAQKDKPTEHQILQFLWVLDRIPDCLVIDCIRSWSETI